MRCLNTGCQWNRKGKCLLFRGVTQLECKYRELGNRKLKSNQKKGKK